MFRRSPASLLLVLTLLIGGTGLPHMTAAQATPEAGLAAPQSTAILVAATNDPLAVLGSDGLLHLEYDLIVTNAFVSPVTLSTIEVFGDDGQPLLRLEGDVLTSATQNLLFGGERLTEIPASGTVAVVVDVAAPPGRTPDRLTHQITYALAPDSPIASLIGSLTIEGPDLPVDPREAIVLSPPLRGPGWVGLGCCEPTSLHRSIRLVADGDRIAKSETFAIDWIRVQDGQAYTGDGAENAQWFGYGAEVLAAAAGEVVAVRDGMAEETPNQPPVHVREPGDYGGNHVTIEIAPGIFAFYAHLQPGSIAVAVGDQVEAGQPLGLLGNSGNSTAPHLHFGLLDSPDPLIGNSLPMVFDAYTVTGVLDLTALSGAAGTPTAATPVAEAMAVPQTETLPLHLTIADFG